MSAQSGHAPIKQRSLALRFVRITVLGQALFGVMLGLGAGAFVVASEQQARQVFMEDVAGAMAASLMPMVMDRDIPAVQGQLETLQLITGRGDLRGIEFSDATGQVLAAIGDVERDSVQAPGPLWERLFGPHYIERPIALDGVHYGSIRLAFAERTLVDAFGAATIVTLLVMSSAVLVSALWFSWLVVRTVIEPIQAIQVAAGELASGKRNIALDLQRNDEIGQLGSSIENLALQLKRGEEALREAARKARLAQMSEARLRAEAEEVARVKSDFVAVVAHELGTPLSVVNLYSDVLASSNVRETDREIAEVVDGLSAAASRLSSIANDLMDTALLDRGVMRISMAPTDLAEVARETVRDVARAIDTHRVVFDPRCGSEETIVHADRVRVRQIMDNLLSNAIKYTPTGTTVSVRCFTREESAVVEVSDEGPGIPADKRSHVFEIFGRLDHSDNRDTAGLGLGLAISARIAEAHGGTLRFHPGPGGTGTVFTLAIPLLKSEKTDGSSTAEISFAPVDEEAE